MTPARERRLLPGIVQGGAQMGAVLGVCGNWAAASAFFLVACLLVTQKARIPRPRWPVYKAFAAAVLTGLLLLFRGLPHLGPLRLSFLPAGFAFIGASYCYLRAVYAVMDSRRWDARVFGRYFFFAPTFFSGPVMSPGEFRARRGRPNRAGAAQGAAHLLAGGLRITAAYLLLNLSPLASAEQVPITLASWPTPLLLPGVFLSGVWLYLNFSGFSDVYIGLSHLLGVRAPENFDNPFAATTLTAFWQRWHVSLGSWLRAVVYDPLSRWMLSRRPKSTVAVSVIAPIVTMVACGAWHVLSPAFLLWGLLHGLGLATHAVWRHFAAPRLPPGLRAHWTYHGASWLLTHAFVAVTWIFFLPTGPEVGLDTRLRLLGALVGLRG